MARQFYIDVKITKTYVNRRTLAIWAESESEAQKEAIETVNDWDHGNCDDFHVEVE